jgi:hypothetical protein
MLLCRTLVEAKHRQLGRRSDIVGISMTEARARTMVPAHSFWGVLALSYAAELCKVRLFVLT